MPPLLPRKNHKTKKKTNLKSIKEIKGVICNFNPVTFCHIQVIANQHVVLKAWKGAVQFKWMLSSNNNLFAVIAGCSSHKYNKNHRSSTLLPRHAALILLSASIPQRLCSHIKSVKALLVHLMMQCQQKPYSPVALLRWTSDLVLSEGCCKRLSLLPFLFCVRTERIEKHWALERQSRRGKRQGRVKTSCVVTVKAPLTTFKPHFPFWACRLAPNLFLDAMLQSSASQPQPPPPLFP